jgi:CheY-like chemotaxis protein
MVNSYLENSGKATNYLNTEKHPDAIICDYNLPSNKRYIPFDCIRENREFDNIPFVLLSEEF